VSTEKIFDGNHAAAEAMRQIDPEVVPAYPITPTSYIMEVYSKFVNDGKVTSEMITVESEHAAMSACVGASAAGGRVITATSSQGLALMHEVLFNASGLRLPIILINGNRSLGAPLSIHCDHSDSMAQRDTGFIQWYAKDAQEMYDFLLQSVLIAEDDDVRTPVMANMDAFLVTHTHQKLTVEDDAAVKKFIGEPNVKNSLLDLENPVSYGGATRPDYYQEARRNQLQGLLNAYEVIQKVGKKFGETFGRDYSEFGEGYFLEDAEYVFVQMGSSFGTVQAGVDMLREKGIKAGILRIRLFRPFPSEYIRQMLKNAKYVLVMDRTSPAGGEGAPVFMEIRSAMYDAQNRPKIFPFVYGLGSKDFNPAHVVAMQEKVNEAVENNTEMFPEESFWVNLRGE
jgi:pyruvate ferredoxin oxidoreductase alpha subunit